MKIVMKIWCKIVGHKWGDSKWTRYVRFQEGVDHFRECACERCEKCKREKVIF